MRKKDIDKKWVEALNAEGRLRDENDKFRSLLNRMAEALERISSDWSVPDHRVPIAKEALEEYRKANL